MSEQAPSPEALERAREIQQMYRYTNQSLGYKHYEPALEAIAAIIAAAIDAAQGDLISREAAAEVAEQYDPVFSSSNYLNCGLDIAKAIRALPSPPQKEEPKD